MNEEALLAEALARPVSERAAYLEQACAGRPELRGALEARLAGELSTLSPRDIDQTLPSAAQPPGEAGPAIADRYTLLDKIGEGGMGEVWIAQQTEPVKRRVALKLIKAGMDSRAFLQRFEQERQALAVMDHPNIARVLDGGMTSAGQPFFVMELVAGQPLTNFCDEARLTLRQRLELFVPICQAVQHAHQKGIVHRDLKPANILVGTVDGRPVPKVIDFGVAKATAGKLTDQPLATRIGAIVGTLEYMSPEQAGGAQDVDTRSDIYSLGVILYELLAGVRPLDAGRLKKAAMLDIVLAIMEEEPAKPSTRLTTLETLPELAALRQTEPRRLKALLKGDLDAVVMKCLEKDRARRYETANGLARDLQRYLADEVVEARPPSAGYRLKKFVRRHKGQVLAASLVLLVLVAGMAGTTWGLFEAKRQQGRAETGETLAGERLVQVEAEKKKTEEEKQIAVAVKDFLQHKLLGQADVRAQANALLNAGGQAAAAKKDLTIRELLDRAAGELSEANIEANFPNQPLLQAELLQTVGNTYLGVDDPERAIGFLLRSLALRQAKLGPEHRDTLTTMNCLAGAYQADGKVDMAVPLYEETLKLRKAKLGPEHVDTLISMNDLANAHVAAGDVDLALPLYEEALKLMKAQLGPEHAYTLVTMNNLAWAYQAAGKLNLALPVQEETLKLQKAKLGPEHPDTLATMNNLAAAYLAVGKFDRALPLFEETFKLMKATLGPEHRDTLITKKSLEFARALITAEERYQAKLTELGPKHIDTLLARRDVAQMYMSTQRLGDAESMLIEVLQGMSDRPPDDPIVVFTTGLLRRCLIMRQRANPDAWTTFNSESLLGGALLGEKKYADAEPLLKAGYEGMKRQAQAIPDSKSRLCEAAERLVRLYEATGNKDEAARWRQELAAAGSDSPPEALKK